MSDLVVVVGDVLLDRDITGSADRLCPDAPVPVLVETASVERPGGAGLAATFLSRDGIDVALIGAIGSDPAGETLRTLLCGDRVDLVELPYGGPTPEKIRFRAGGHPLLRLDRSVAVGPFGDPPRAAANVLYRASAVLVSDYGRAVTSLPALRRILADVAAHVPVVWDPHPRGSTPVAGSRLVCPNRTEAATFAAAHGVDVNPAAMPELDLVAVEARLLRTTWRVGSVAVTMGRDGALVVGADNFPVALPTRPSHAGDTCGAGDRFSASATAALAGGRSIRDAVAQAVEAASRYVAADGPASLLSDFALEAK